MGTLSGVAQGSQKITTDYLNLLITQLQNQNPLDPLDNQEMASQLAQLSQLEQIEGMNRTFSEVLASTQQGQAASLIGKEVSWFPEDATEAVRGRVEGVDLSEGNVKLQVGNSIIELSDIEEIRE